MRGDIMCGVFEAEGYNNVTGSVLSARLVAVSRVTLALLEDQGFFVPDYAEAVRCQLSTDQH